MSGRVQLMLALGAALLVGAITWLWYDQMEKRWSAVERVSHAASENPMLAATLLLRRQGHPVTVAGSFGEINLAELPDGALIIGDSSGVTTPATAGALLAWVGRGNTLVTEPRWINPAERAAIDAAAADDDETPPAVIEEEEEEEEEEVEEDAEDDAEEDAEDGADQAPAIGNETAPVVVALPPAPALETDPLAARLGVRQLYRYRMRKCPELDVSAAAAPAARPARPARRTCVPAAEYKPRLRTLLLPGAPYALTLDESHTALVSMPDAPAPLWRDQAGEAVRAYGHGNGHIVMLTANYFNNSDLRQFDHAELLLALAALGQLGKNVTIVHRLDILPWYTALWQHYHLLLVALACFLALAFWMAVRRFGPLLPEPAVERRSLMEHIAASGAWLWKAEGGRQVLLEAAREDTLALVRRRAPGLFRLPSQQLPAALARDTGLDPEHLSQALQDDASQQVARFTRQIRTLQELRNHYER